VAEGEQPKCVSQEISAEETAGIIKMLVRYLDIVKIRLTGGEPLISNKLTVLLPLLSPLGVKDLSLTTNGQTLSQKAAFLKKNGMERINVSLDTLDQERFRLLTRGGKLEKTLAGIKQAQMAGLKIKVNMVPMKGVNEDEIVEMLDYCLENGIELRYIELMRMGHLADKKLYENKVISMHYLLDRIKERYGISRSNNTVNSTATRFEIKGRGYFGIIANDSEPFCETCDRLRLTAEGELLGCISSTHNFSIKELLHQSEEVRKEKLNLIFEKAMATKRELSFSGTATSMKTFGG
jgi:cyclic pyranopterin phosphate synthase